MIIFAIAVAVAMPAKYERLVTDARLARVIAWQDANDTHAHPYANWDQPLKDMLARALTTLDGGGRLSPPTFRDADAPTTDEARTVYVQRVAISLWVEANHAVGWSLFDASARAREDMIGFRHLFHIQNGRYVWAERVKDLDPYWAFEFMTRPQRIPYLAAERTIAGSTPEDTVVGLIDRLRTLVHHAADDEMNAPKPPARQIIDGNITTGCWGTSGLIVTLLRSINIPASQVTHTLNGSTHSSVLFTGIGNKTMTHGDDPYNQFLLAVLSRDLLIDNDAVWAAMSNDPEREHRWHAEKAVSCINARYVLALGCASPMYSRIVSKEIDPYLSPAEKDAFHRTVDVIIQTSCPTFSTAAPAFPLQCWTPR
ncbi:MAG TPA: hypothetical protein VFA59_10790 [Vicinamibacterales bacterium]|nr:hypothetical protein [Vicinamibacterales bacterium]